MRMAPGPASPLGPCWPCWPGSPFGPWMPCWPGWPGWPASPFAPVSPFGPWGPASLRALRAGRPHAGARELTGFEVARHERLVLDVGRADGVVLDLLAGDLGGGIGAAA